MLTMLLIMMGVMVLGLLFTVLSGIIACLPIVLVIVAFVLADILLIKMIFKKKK